MRSKSQRFSIIHLILVLATVAVVGVMLVMPLAVVFTEALAKGWDFLWQSLQEPDARAAIRLSLLVAAIVVPTNTAIGLCAAWCLTHFRFPGRGLLVGILELPFAVSPVISGMIFVLLFGRQGFAGPWLQAHGLQIVFALPGIVLATLFVTLPFVARQLMPLMASLGTEEEQAALTLGASGWQMFVRITLPRISWSLLTGILLCNARAMGEFGAVSVVSGHIRGATNTMPLHIEILYNEYNLPAAFAMASLLALLAIATIGFRLLLEWRSRRLVVRGEQAIWVQI